MYCAAHTGLCIILLKFRTIMITIKITMVVRTVLIINMNMKIKFNTCKNNNNRKQKSTIKHHDIAACKCVLWVVNGCNVTRLGLVIQAEFQANHLGI